MRLLIPLILLPGVAMADITSLAECEAAIAEDPFAAREAASKWYRLGGGTSARICELTTLEATGAGAIAAAGFTQLAQNPNAGLDGPGRAQLFADAARLWRDFGQLNLAQQTLTNALDLAPATPERLHLMGLILADQSDWERLDELAREFPQEAVFLALHARAKNGLSNPAAALDLADKALVLADGSPLAQLEKAEALMALDQKAEALEIWMSILREHPETDHANRAQDALRDLN